MELNKQIQTSWGMGSLESNIRTTWSMLGLFSAFKSIHLRAVKRARFSSFVEGLLSRFGSTTSSERLLATIILSQSTRFTYRRAATHQNMEGLSNITVWNLSADTLSSSVSCKIFLLTWKFYMQLLYKSWRIFAGRKDSICIHPYELIPPALNIWHQDQLN